MDSQPALAEQPTESEPAACHVGAQGRLKIPEFLAQPGHELLDRRKRQAALRQLADHPLALGSQASEPVLCNPQITQLDPEVQRPFDLRVQRSQRGLDPTRLGPRDPLAQIVERDPQRVLGHLFGERLPDGAKYGALKVCLRDLHAVLAGLSIPMPRAAPDRAASHRMEGAATLRALEEARQQPLPVRPAADRAAQDFAFPVALVLLIPPAARRLRGVPQLIGDDAPAFVLLAHPLALGPMVENARAGIVILHPLRLVPDPLAAIQGIAEHLPDRRRRPRLTARRGRPLRIQLMRERSQPQPLVRITLEQTADDCRALRHDLQPVALRHGMPMRILTDHDGDRLVAEGCAAGGEPAVETPAESAVRVLPDLL